ncbi:hypothetical protein C8Q73DRAFT_141747 [Cubamyces lactineus]|nr:hypothetical protein C8Q73DRAFT_141747 [Cubamyces lactineus]
MRGRLTWLPRRGAPIRLIVAPVLLSAVPLRPSPPPPFPTPGHRPATDPATRQSCPARGGSPARTRARTLPIRRRPHSGKRARPAHPPGQSEGMCRRCVKPSRVRGQLKTRLSPHPRARQPDCLERRRRASARLPGSSPLASHLPSSNCLCTSTSVLLIEYRGPRFRCLVAEDVVVKTTIRRTRPRCALVCLYGRFPASLSAPRGYEPPLLMRSSPKRAVAGAPSRHSPAQTPKNSELATLEAVVLWSIRWTSILRYRHGPSGSSPS